MNRDEKLSTIIELCKDIDGCTLGYILRSIGMEEQMLRQLILKADWNTINYLTSEKQEIWPRQ
jgi:hypothetical protein